MTNQITKAAGPQRHPWERAQHSAAELADALRDVQSEGFWGHWQAHVDPTEGDRRPIFFMQGKREPTGASAQESAILELFDEYRNRTEIARKIGSDHYADEREWWGLQPGTDEANRMFRKLDRGEKKLAAALTSCEEVFLQLIDLPARSLPELKAKAIALTLYRRPFDCRHKDAPQRLEKSIWNDLLALPE